jgi:hypothetical protein
MSSAAAAAAAGCAAACVGPCCEAAPAKSAAAAAAAAAAAVPAGRGVRCVTDDELLGLSVLTKLMHLELQHVAVNGSTVDELQRLLPCTRIRV